MTMSDLDGEREIFDTLRNRLETTLVSDIFDLLGIHGQAMRAEVRPVFPGASVVGRAYPVRALDSDETGDNPFLNILDVVSSLKPDDVLVIGSSGSLRTALFGDLLAGAAQVRGAAGLVTDGALRDIKQLAELNFPGFAAGITMVDPTGKAGIVEPGRPVPCGGVTVNPGDIVFGDINGVVVIPRERAAETVEKALELAAEEALLRDRLSAGDDVRRTFDSVINQEP
jgi:regulator of RNase E activity RraA